MIWCFDEGSLDTALEQFAEHRFKSGHNPDAIIACVTGIEAFLKSPEAVKLTVQSITLPPLDNPNPERPQS